MTKATKIYTAVFLAITFNINFFAQDISREKIFTTDPLVKEITSTEIKTYNSKTEPVNTGIRRSTINTDGIHGINGLAKTLLKHYPKEKDDDIKIIIAVALYMIGDK